MKCANPGCSKCAMFGAVGTKKKIFCRAHAQEGMVSLKVTVRCEQAGCKKRPTFGVVGTNKKKFCRTHAQEGMLSLEVGVKCAHGDCSKLPTFGFVGRRKQQLFCREHTHEGMVCLKKKVKCAHPDCGRVPSYGVVGSRKTEFCAKHARGDMVYLKGKMKCAHLTCGTSPSFGVVGSNKMEFCAKHAQEGMVYLRGRVKCTQRGCETLGTFGVVGSKKKLRFCLQHAQKGMIRLKTRTICAHPGCLKIPSFGFAGSKKREFCREHAPEGMIAGYSRGRTHKGSNKRPLPVVVATEEREFCTEYDKNRSSTINLKPGGAGEDHAHNSSGSAARPILSTDMPSAQSAIGGSATSGCSGSTSSGNVCPPSAIQNGEDRAPSSTQPAISTRSARGTRKLGRVGDGRTNADQRRAFMETAGAVDSSPPRCKDIVKTEEVSLASRVVVDEDSAGDVARRGTKRERKVGGPHRVKAEHTPSANTDGGGRRRCSKRLRRGVDLGVVLLGPDDPMAASETNVDTGSVEANVTVKPQC